MHESRSFEIETISERKVDLERSIGIFRLPITFRKGDSSVGIQGHSRLRANKLWSKTLENYSRESFTFKSYFCTLSSGPLTRESFGSWRTHGPEPNIYPSIFFSTCIISNQFSRILFSNVFAFSFVFQVDYA